jgi:aspartyl-tRNA(Asn)/glutamyl-tRNA(Gln) amidotransferase subunit A
MDSIFFHRHPAPQLRHPGFGPLSIAVAVNRHSRWRAGRRMPVPRRSNGFTALEDASVVQRLRTAGSSSVRFSPHQRIRIRAVQAARRVRRVASRPPMELVLDMMGESRLAASTRRSLRFQAQLRTGLALRSDRPDSLDGVLRDLVSPSGLRSAYLAGGRRSGQLGFLAARGEAARPFPAGDRPGRDAHRCASGSVTRLAGPAGSRVSRVGRHLQRAGFPVREVSLAEFPLYCLVHKIVGSVEASSCAGRYDSVRYGSRVPGAKNWNDMYLLARGAAFGPLVKSYLFQGAYFQFERYEAYLDACRIRARCWPSMQRLTSQVRLPGAARRRWAHRRGIADVAGRNVHQFGWTRLPTSPANRPCICRTLRVRTQGNPVGRGPFERRAAACVGRTSAEYRQKGQ